MDLAVASRQRKIQDSVRQQLYVNFATSHEGQQLVSDLENQINNGGMFGGKAMNWEVAMNTEKLGINKQDVIKNPAQALSYGILYKMADIASDDYMYLRKGGMSHQEALSSAMVDINSTGPDGRTIFDLLKDKDYAPMVLNDLTKLDKYGQPYTKLISGRTVITGLDEDLDAGSSFGVFVQNVAEKTGLGTFLLDAYDYVSGNSPEFFTDYRAAAIRENLIQKDQDVMLGKFGRTASEVLGYGASIAENFLAGAVGGTYGIVGLNVLKGALGDVQYSTGLEKAPSAEEFISSRVFDLVTTAAGMSLSQMAAESIGFGFMGAKAAYKTAFEDLMAGSLMKAAMFPIGNAVTNTLFDMSIDFGVHNLTKGFIPYTPMQSARLDITGDVKQDFSNVANQFLLRSAMVLGGGLVNSRIAKGTNADPIIMSKSWIDENSDVRYRQEHPNMYKIQKIVSSLAWSAYPGNLKIIDQLWKASPGTEGSFGKAIDTGAVSFKDYLVLWMNAERGSNNLVRWLFKDKEYPDARNLLSILGRQDTDPIFNDLTKAFANAITVVMDDSKKVSFVKTTDEYFQKAKALLDYDNLDDAGKQAAIKSILEARAKVKLYDDYANIPDNEKTRIKNFLRIKEEQSIRNAFGDDQAVFALKVKDDLDSITPKGEPLIEKTATNTELTHLYMSALKDNNLAQLDMSRVTPEQAARITDRLERMVYEIRSGDEDTYSFVKAMKADIGNEKAAVDYLEKVYEGVRKIMSNKNSNPDNYISFIDVMDSIYKASSQYIWYQVESLKRVLNDQNNYKYTDDQLIQYGSDLYWRMAAALDNIGSRLDPREYQRIEDSIRNFDSSIYKNKSKWSKMIKATLGVDIDISLKDAMIELMDSHKNRHKLRSQLTQIAFMPSRLMNALDIKDFYDIYAPNQQVSDEQLAKMQHVISAYMFSNVFAFDEVINRQKMITVNDTVYSDFTYEFYQTIFNSILQNSQSITDPEQSARIVDLTGQLDKIVGVVVSRFASIAQQKLLGSAPDPTMISQQAKILAIQKELNKIFPPNISKNQPLIQIESYDNIGRIKLKTNTSGQADEENLILGLGKLLFERLDTREMMGDIDFDKTPMIKGATPDQRYALRKGPMIERGNTFTDVVKELKINDPNLNENIRMMVALSMAESKNVFDIFNDTASYNKLRSKVESLLEINNFSIYKQIKDMGNDVLNDFVNSLIHRNLMTQALELDLTVAQLAILAKTRVSNINVADAYGIRLAYIDTEHLDPNEKPNWDLVDSTITDRTGLRYFDNVGTTSTTRMYYTLPFDTTEPNHAGANMKQYAIDYMNRIKNQLFNGTKIRSQNSMYELMAKKISAIPDTDSYEVTLNKIFKIYYETISRDLEYLKERYPSFTKSNVIEITKKLAAFTHEIELSGVDKVLSMSMEEMGNKYVEGGIDDFATFIRMNQELVRKIQTQSAEDITFDEKFMTPFMQKMITMSTEEQSNFLAEAIRQETEKLNAIPKTNENEINAQQKLIDALTTAVDIIKTKIDPGTFELLRKVVLKGTPNDLDEIYNSFSKKDVLGKEKELVRAMLTKGLTIMSNESKTSKRMSAAINNPMMSKSSVDYIINQLRAKYGPDLYKLTVRITNNQKAGVFGDVASGTLKMRKYLNDLITVVSGIRSSSVTGKYLLEFPLTKVSAVIDHGEWNIDGFTPDLDIDVDNFKGMMPEMFRIMFGLKGDKAALFKQTSANAPNGAEIFEARGEDAITAIRLMLNSMSVHAEIVNNSGNKGHPSRQENLFNPYAPLLTNNILQSSVDVYTNSKLFQKRANEPWDSYDSYKQFHNTVMSGLRQITDRTPVGSNKLLFFDPKQIANPNIIRAVSQDLVDNYSPNRKLKIKYMFHGKEKTSDGNPVLLAMIPIVKLAREAEIYINDRSKSKILTETSNVLQIVKDVFNSESTGKRLSQKQLDGYSEYLLNYMSQDTNDSIYSKMVINLKEVYGDTAPDKEIVVYAKINNRYGVDNPWHWIPQFITHVSNTGTGDFVGLNKEATKILSADFDGDTVSSYPTTKNAMKRYFKERYGLESIGALDNDSTLYKYLIAEQNAALKDIAFSDQYSIYGDLLSKSDIQDAAQLGGMIVAAANRAGNLTSVLLAFNDYLNIDSGFADLNDAEYSVLSILKKIGSTIITEDDGNRISYRIRSRVPLEFKPDMEIVMLADSGYFKPKFFGSLDHISKVFSLGNRSIHQYLSDGGDVYTIIKEDDGNNLGGKYLGILLTRNINQGQDVFTGQQSAAAQIAKKALMDYTGEEPLQISLTKLLNSATDKMPDIDAEHFINTTSLKIDRELRGGSYSEVAGQLYRILVDVAKTDGGFVQMLKRANLKKADDLNTLAQDFFVKLFMAQQYKIGYNASEDSFNPILSHIYRNNITPVEIEDMMRFGSPDMIKSQIKSFQNLLDNTLNKDRNKVADKTNQDIINPEMERLIKIATMKESEPLFDSRIDWGNVSSVLIDRSLDNYISKVGEHLRVAEYAVNSGFGKKIKDSVLRDAETGNVIMANGKPVIDVGSGMRRYMDAYQFFSGGGAGLKTGTKFGMLPTFVKVFVDFIDQASMNVNSDFGKSIRRALILPDEFYTRFNADEYFSNLQPDKNNMIVIPFGTTEMDVTKDKMWKAAKFMKVIDNTYDMKDYIMAFDEISYKLKHKDVLLGKNINSMDSLVKNVYRTINNTIGSQYPIAPGHVRDIIDRVWGLRIGKPKLTGEILHLNTDFVTAHTQKLKASAINKDTTMGQYHTLVTTDNKPVKIEHLVNQVRKTLSEGYNGKPLNAFEKEMVKTVFTGLLGHIDSDSSHKATLAAMGLTSKIAEGLKNSFLTDGQGWKMDINKINDINFLIGETSNILNNGMYDQLFLPAKISRFISTTEGCN